MGNLVVITLSVDIAYPYRAVGDSCPYTEQHEAEVSGA